MIYLVPIHPAYEKSTRYKQLLRTWSFCSWNIPDPDSCCTQDDGLYISIYWTSFPVNYKGAWGSSLSVVQLVSHQPTLNYRLQKFCWSRQLLQKHMVHPAYTCVNSNNMALYSNCWEGFHIWIWILNSSIVFKTIHCSFEFRIPQ